mmetsp:Transcript_23643/g.3928  ORF Transcript_23643/g.3928 Transcript_23643/m.3928 type:complete len:160 (+) Transcript_23643:266-745(+)
MVTLVISEPISYLPTSFSRAMTHSTPICYISETTAISLLSWENTIVLKHSSGKRNFLTLLRWLPCFKSTTVTYGHRSYSKYSAIARNLLVFSLVIAIAVILATSGGVLVQFTLIKLISFESRDLTAICLPTGYIILPVSSSPNITQSLIDSEAWEPNAW